MDTNQGMRGTILEKKRNKSRLIFFPLPFQGHINPMIQLANILHSTGNFDISIIHTRFNSPDPSKYPDFTFHPISDPFSELHQPDPDPLIILKLLNKNCVEPFRKCLVRLLSDGSDQPIKCLVSDANWYFSQSVADSLNLKRIVMRVTNACALLAYTALPLLRQRGYLSNTNSTRMEEPLEELPPLKVKDIPVLGMFNAEDMFENITLMVEETKKASAIIFNTSQELEEPELAKLRHDFPIPTFAMPFHKCFSASSSSLLTQDRKSISWLNKQTPKSVLYISFGSIAFMDGQKLREMASGLANSQQPFLWVVRPGLVNGSDWVEMLPDGFLEETRNRGHIIKWAPQQEVLAHRAVGGFWTHNGWNSTLESICEGVPMLCSPFFADQMINAAYVSDVWKIGIRLEKGLERGEIESAIKKLMVEKEGEEMKQRAMVLKEKIDAGLNKGGSTKQSLDGLVDFISSL